MRRLVSLVTIVAIVALVGCNQKQSSDGRDRSPIKIGYYGDLSGATVNFGQSARNGVLMAVDEINRADGISGRRLEVVMDEDEGKAELAAERSNKLIGG